jgi:predicted NBD/HSP70 family sugar kinase
MLNPDVVVFAGGVSACLPLMRDVFDLELARSVPAFTLANTTIGYSAFGESAGVVGAAKLATLWRPK